MCITHILLFGGFFMKTIAEQRHSNVLDVLPWHHFFDKWIDEIRKKDAKNTFYLRDKGRHVDYNIYQYSDDSLLLATCAGFNPDGGCGQEIYENMKLLKDKDSRLYSILVENYPQVKI